MKTLERLDKEGNVMFEKQYPAGQAARILASYKYYPQSQIEMWREKVEAPKRGRKSKENEED